MGTSEGGEGGEVGTRGGGGVGGAKRLGEGRVGTFLIPSLLIGAFD